MTTVQKFKKSILFVVLYVVICDMTESKLPAFHCDSAGNVILESQDDLNKTEIVQAKGKFCKPTQLQLSIDCPQAANTPIEIIFGAPVKSVENGSTIIGGLNSEFGKLSCKDTKVKVSATAKPFSVSTPAPQLITEKIVSMTHAIKLSIGGLTDNVGVQLGQTLSLILEGPDDKHFLFPIECKAFGTGTKHTIWERHSDADSKDCQHEPSVIVKNWKNVTVKAGTPKKLSIEMYAFRFATSPSVTIECSAFVCPSSDKTADCTEKCIGDDSSRRRRAIHGIQTSPKSNNTTTKVMVASTSFQVQLGDQNTGNSAERLSKNVQLYSVTSIFVLMVTMMIR